MKNLQNLLKNKCPICSDDLCWDKESELLICDCGFFMDESDYNYEMEQLHAQEYHIPDTDENLTGLNNL